MEAGTKAGTETDVEKEKPIEWGFYHCVGGLY
jgi:hypothetical protein